ncbi:hypothetical protein CAPTEDRAFT_97931 [Capitella teleta]|uniref:OBG-type G domain-containing protein n=1 Tax=Capitella teleta TaxID=283909 RepID=R7UZR9_CAPTE|nr:hypothetical protein CAPTEDRAFT_97931 [Capitella teleta]|eukprot:ELU11784.1 hypothetical protein CAPTEDRAFT_97931 [Capitella teleta]
MQASHFVDFRLSRVQGGQGGKGAMSFLSLYAKEWAGPDGGDGGNGGHVVFQANRNLRSLSNVRAVHIAQSGGNGKSKYGNGKNADHTVIQVPVGSLFKDEFGEFVAELEQHDDLYVAARGGAGGHGNYFFLSNDNRAPTTYEEGGLGEEKTLSVELRVMAHVGLVGFPNAGKSTLLRAISKARPKVASYAFTTLNPHIGIVEYEDHEQVAVADIPGLIPGAHLNKGLGFSFLRHIERCVCLLYVLDLTASQGPRSQLQDLRYELEQYSSGLSQRPAAIVANKTDVGGVTDLLDELTREEDLPVIAISAKKKNNTQSVVQFIRKLYDQHALT